MSRPRLVRLTVTGPGRPPAAVDFGPRLTLISGMSNTGKTHVLECIDFVLGANRPPRETPEARGYTDIELELSYGAATYAITRRLPAPETVVIRKSSASAPPEERELKVDIAAAQEASATLSGWLLELGGFDPAMPVVKNQKGVTQRLSFRTVAPLCLVKEADVISTHSPAAPPQQGGSTAPKSVFRIVLTGSAPTPQEVAQLRRGHTDRERAKQEVAFLDEILAQLRDEIREANVSRRPLEAELARIDDELATVADAVSKSGERVRGLMKARNEALREADEATAEHQRARELHRRFSLLGEHYAADVRRLEFVVEGGHFFQQITASHCPCCGRAFDEDDEICHPEAAPFDEMEAAARAEIKKLRPRMADLLTAIEENERQAATSQARANRATRRAKQLDAEIREVANPSASNARERVKELGTRRREVEQHLMHFRELERYVLLRHTADARSKQKVDRYRPEQAPPSLVSLAGHVRTLLEDWKFPFSGDVSYSQDTDDLVIDGKPRDANGKGVLAVTHAAFTIGLMEHCIEKGTPHPGFVVIDTPLRHFRGPNDEEDDQELSEGLHSACLKSLASSVEGQSVIIENVNPPADLHETAVVHWFSGPGGEGRRGFYPA